MDNQTLRQRQLLWPRRNGFPFSKGYLLETIQARPHRWLDLLKQRLISLVRSGAQSNGQPWFAKYGENPFGLHFRKKKQGESILKNGMRGRLQVQKDQITGKRRVHEETAILGPMRKGTEFKKFKRLLTSITSSNRESLIRRLNKQYLQLFPGVPHGHLDHTCKVQVSRKPKNHNWAS